MAPYGSAIKAWPSGQIMAATPREGRGDHKHCNNCVTIDEAISMSDPARLNSVPKMMLSVYETIVGLTAIVLTADNLSVPRVALVSGAAARRRTLEPHLGG